MNTTEVDYHVDTVEKPLRFGRHGPRQDAEIDITPMIDITFLLLIFFLVATRLSSESFVDLPAAQHGTAVSPRQAVVLTVARKGEKGEEEAVIYKGDGTSSATMLTASDLNDQQEEMEAYIDRGIHLEGKTHVLIKAEEDVKHRDVARVARAAGDATVAVLYVAVQESP